mmetsp:Transcript_36772/g.54022  ORF Transcript_36772/g.54022 Transcript_36772/m.54022 type:complete len:115 (+) Transcript_36772:286-630(+)
MEPKSSANTKTDGTNNIEISTTTSSLCDANTKYSRLHASARVELNITFHIFDSASTKRSELSFIQHINNWKYECNKKHTAPVSNKRRKPFSRRILYTGKQYKPSHAYNSNASKS